MLGRCGSDELMLSVGPRSMEIGKAMQYESTRLPESAPHFSPEPRDKGVLVENHVHVVSIMTWVDGSAAILDGLGVFAPKATKARQHLVNAFKVYHHGDYSDGAQVTKERIRAMQA